MVSAKQNGLRKSVVYLSLGVALGACAPNTQNVPVQNVPPTRATPVGATQGASSVNQLNALQAEIRELRNQIEEQQYEVENLKQRQQDLFQGLDQRLRVAETVQQGGNVVSPDGTVITPGGLPPLGSEAQPAGQGQPQLPASAGTPAVGQAPDSASPASPAQPAQVTVGGADQQALYDQGFDYLKQSKYTEAIDLFTQLVTQFPNDGLADDASYWIGEANYVNRQYEAAIRSFRKVVTQYPQSDRVPEALLKVGYVQYDIGDYKSAKSTFEDVLRRYPDHPVSISAKSRLQRIEQGISG